MAYRARPLHEYESVSSADTVCLFHFSIGSAAGRLAFHAPDRLVAIYHNITPATFFLGFHPHLAGLCYHGRRELEAFAPRSELALGDSEFNRRELEAAGFARTGVLPIVLDLEAYGRKPSATVARLYGDGRHEPALRGPHHPQQADRRPRPGVRRLQALSRSAAAGSCWWATPAATSATSTVCSRWSGRLRLDDVVFTGHVDDDELLAYYRVSPLFLCLSEHEGFCVPLQEAMHFGLPVVAYDAGAVRETPARRRRPARARSGPRWWPSWCTRSCTTSACGRRCSRRRTAPSARSARTDFGALLLRAPRARARARCRPLAAR